MKFEDRFKQLTGHHPFPWQEALYELFMKGEVPKSCSIPTGLGKTNVIAVWLIALSQDGKMPRRLVYVVNRRTVVDQTTSEAVRLRDNAWKIGVERPPAISTLRGQFVDNREWFSDPSRPAIICGTVDMIGSRLLFSGYGIGFKSRPLQAGFLGQDALIIHDEAHLEPAFQKLIEAIRYEQDRCKEFKPLHVMELTATRRSDRNQTESDEKPFELTDAEKNPPEQIPDVIAGERPIYNVWRRLKAKKKLCLTPVEDKQTINKIAEIAADHRDANAAVLVFVRTIDAITAIEKELAKTKRQVLLLTGTMRGKERDELVENPEFKRFLKGAESGETVYLVCTSAGEVGIDISAEHMVCDLSTFESMAQRFGRVNRYGECVDTRIDVVYPIEFDEKDKLTPARRSTLALLHKLNGDASPLQIDSLDTQEKQSAFAPPPTILPATDILFDAWSLTTIHGKMPGRPPVAPYLHGVDDWQPPETQVAWREEVEKITGTLLKRYPPEDLLEDYPLKPHELLRDRSSRVFEGLQAIAGRHPDVLAWLVNEYGKITSCPLNELAPDAKAAEKKRLVARIEGCTVLLPPSVGGLSGGMLVDEVSPADDVADDWMDADNQSRRKRLFNDDPRPESPLGMALIFTIDTKVNDDESEFGDEEANTTNARYWHWYARPRDMEDATRASLAPVTLAVHLEDVKKEAGKIVANLDLPEELRRAVILAAEFHDLGKAREVWQRGIGNPCPSDFHAKGGKPEKGPRWRPQELSRYRHEFGSVLDISMGPSHREKLNGFNQDLKDLILHLVAAHHGRARPHFPTDEVLDLDRPQADVDALAIETPRRFARLQRKYGRWGLAYLESLVRAADWAASAGKTDPDPSGAQDGDAA